MSGHKIRKAKFATFLDDKTFDKLLKEYKETKHYDDINEMEDF